MSGVLLMIQDGGRKVVYGTDDGIYLSDFRERNRDPVKVLGLREVLQVDVLEVYQLLVVLSGTDEVIPRHRTQLTFSSCRTSSHHLPSRCSRSHGPSGRAETREADRLTYYFLQDRHLLRQDTGLRRES